MFAKVWKFQLLRGAHRPLGFGCYRRGLAFIRAGLSQWGIELLDAGKITGPLEEENWVANVWKLQLLHGPHRPLGFGRYRRGEGIYLGGSAPMGY